MSHMYVPNKKSVQIGVRPLLCFPPMADLALVQVVRKGTLRRFLSHDVQE